MEDLYVGIFSLAVLLPLLVVGIVVMVFFLLNLRDVLRNVSPQNRTMEPNLVWLNLIPIFSWVWMIITVIRIRDSVRAEFQSRGWKPQGDYGFGVGLAYAILSIVGWGFLGIATLVCFIIYWIRSAEVKNMLAVAVPPTGTGSPSAPPSHGGGAAPGGAAGYATASSEPRRTCTSCGAVAEPGDVFCRSCGARVDSEALSGSSEDSTAGGVTCPFCAFTNRPGAQFCSSCGRSIG